jgi:hypothetical protein
MTARAFVVLVLCVGAASADVKPVEMSPPDVAKWLTFFDKLVSVVAEATGTCEKMAADVNIVIDANKDAVAVARRAHADGKKLPQAAQQRMLEGVKKMVPGMQKCGQHEKVRAAFAKLDLTRKA